MAQHSGFGPDIRLPNAAGRVSGTLRSVLTLHDTAGRGGAARPALPMAAGAPRGLLLATFLYVQDCFQIKKKKSDAIVHLLTRLTPLPFKKRLSRSDEKKKRKKNRKEPYFNKKRAAAASPSSFSLGINGPGVGALAALPAGGEATCQPRAPCRRGGRSPAPRALPEGSPTRRPPPPAARGPLTLTSGCRASSRSQPACIASAAPPSSRAAGRRFRRLPVSSRSGSMRLRREVG